MLIIRGMQQKYDEVLPHNDQNGHKQAGEGKGYPLQYSGLENSTDCIVHGVTNSWTQQRLSHTYFTKKPGRTNEFSRIARYKTKPSIFIH